MSEAELENEEVEEQNNEDNNVIKLRKRKRKRKEESRPAGNFEFLMEIFDEAQRDRAYHDANTNEITARFNGAENAEILCETWKPLVPKVLLIS